MALQLKTEREAPRIIVPRRVRSPRLLLYRLMLGLRSSHGRANG